MGTRLLNVFSCSDSHKVHSFTRKMHAARRESHARRKADGNITDSEDTEVEEKPKHEMDNFQDLQLGSITPVVRRKDNSSSLSPT